VEGAAYVGYDAKGLLVGTLITGWGSINADLIVEVYRIENDRSCTLLGSRRFVLMSRTIYTVSLVNSATSVNQLAVVLRLNVRSVSGSPRVSAFASVVYTRTYRYGFEVGEFAARAAGGFMVYREVRRVVIGPHVAYDGYIAQTATSSLRLEIRTEPVNGVCKDLRVRFTINGRSSVGTSTYRGQYSGAKCHYDINLPGFSQSSFQAEYSFAKAFGGGLFWVLDIEYTDGSTPFVATGSLGGDAFRYWRWAEQWRTTPEVIDEIWANPFLSSALQLYAGPTEPRVPIIYHGLVTIRTDAVERAERVVLTISGREIHTTTNHVAYIRTAEIDLRMQVSVRGIKAMGAAYLMLDDQINPITAPQWLETWSWWVGVFVAGLVFLWSLFFASCVGLRRGFVVVFGLVAAPLALAPLAEPLFLWYAVAPLAVFVVLVYAAYRAYDSLLWGFLFVVGSPWLHVIILAAVDLLTGGLLSQAFDMGFDVYVRWNVPLIAFMDTTSLYVSCKAVKLIFACVKRRRG
jgi:hypothetical protein